MNRAGCTWQQEVKQGFLLRVRKQADPVRDLVMIRMEIHGVRSGGRNPRLVCTVEQHHISEHSVFDPTTCCARNAAQVPGMAGVPGMIEEFSKGAVRIKAPPCRQEAALILQGEAQTAYVVDRS